MLRTVLKFTKVVKVCSKRGKYMLVNDCVANAKEKEADKIRLNIRDAVNMLALNGYMDFMRKYCLNKENLRSIQKALKNGK